MIWINIININDILIVILIVFNVNYIFIVDIIVNGSKFNPVIVFAVLLNMVLESVPTQGYGNCLRQFYILNCFRTRFNICIHGYEIVIVIVSLIKVMLFSFIY